MAQPLTTADIERVATALGLASAKVAAANGQGSLDAERTPAGLTSGVAMAGTTSTAWSRAGAGPPVLLLHGVGEDRSWTLPLLWRLAASNTVTALDLPDHGQSGRLGGRYDAPTLAQWLLAVIDAMGLDAVRLVGTSLGARIALEVALTAPSRVEAQALIAPPLAIASRRQYVPLARRLPAFAASWPLLVHRLPPLATTPMVRVLREVVVHFDVARPDRMTPAWLDAYPGSLARWLLSPRGRFLYFSVARSVYVESPSSVWSRVAGLTVPSLFIWGERDRLVAAGHAANVSNALPSAASVVVPDCGHVMHHENPTLVGGKIVEFFESLLDAAPHNAATSEGRACASG